MTETTNGPTPTGTLIELGPVDGGGTYARTGATEIVDEAGLLAALKRMVRENTSHLELYIRDANAGPMADCTQGKMIYYRGHATPAEMTAQEWERTPDRWKQPGECWRFENCPDDRYPWKPCMTAKRVLGLALHAAGYQAHPWAWAPPRELWNPGARSEPQAKEANA